MGDFNMVSKPKSMRLSKSLDSFNDSSILLYHQSSSNEGFEWISNESNIRTRTLGDRTWPDGLVWIF